MIAEAIAILRPSSTFGITNDDYGTLKWNDPNTNPPSLEEVQLKVAELEAAEPMRLLRQERNRRISVTDWRATVDYPGSDKKLWLDYRQALRDLPIAAEPMLDEQGILTNINWPEAPA